METMALSFAAVVAVAITAYAQYRIPFHTRGVSNQVFLRLLLTAAGVGVGYVSTAGFTGAQSLLSFVAGFGVAHVPAAAILFIKRQRGVTR